jgi:hypothetical protein
MATLRLFCALVSIFSSASGANIVLNGSFETNTAGSSLFNLTNAQVGGTIANVIGFGTAEEIDLVTGSDWGITPQDGNWKVGIHHQAGGALDVFSIALSGTTGVGNTYALSYYGAGISGIGLGLVEVGLSSSPTAFGTVIYSAGVSDIASWGQFGGSIVAPVAGAYLTFRVANSDALAFVDNITFDGEVAPEPVTGTPEPLTLSAVAAGLIGLSVLRRRL